ncbi:MAG: AAA family ATPase, partial [Planctomycetota bacterium]
MSDLPNNPRGEGLSDVELGTFCRDEELSQLLDHVRRGLNAVTTSEAPDGEATTSLVLLQGSSGMGKSRLSERTREAAEEMGVRVRETFCYERQGIPFLPLLRLVKELISESADQRALWSRYAHVLGRVFPELANELGESGDLIELPGEDGKVQFFDALTSLLSELSREKPILLIVHDLHRSDRGTVDFIEY